MSEEPRDLDACDSPWRWDDIVIAAGFAGYLAYLAISYYGA